METFASLEIGSSRITCLIGGKKNTGDSHHTQSEVEILGIGVEDCEVMNQGAIINIDAAAKSVESAIKKAELMSGIEVEEVLLSVPAKVCKGIKSDGMVAIAEKDGSREVGIEDIQRVVEIAESVSLNTDQTIIHNIPSSFRVDDQVYEEPLGVIGVRLEVTVFLVYCSKMILDNLTRVVEKAGYELADVTLETLAATEAVLTPDEKRSNNLIIDIGAQYTTAIQYTDRSLSGLYSIDIGGRSISKDLSFALKTSIEEAERLKKEYGAADASLVDDEMIEVSMVTYNKFAQISKKGIAQVIEARLEEICSLVRQKVEEDKMANLGEYGVVLVGGNALIEGCEQVAERVFNAPSRVGDPLKITGLDKNLHRADQATPVGLIRIAIDKSEHYEDDEDEPSKFKRKSGEEGGSIKNYIKSFFN